MAAARNGDSRRALDDLSAAVAALPGDPTAEPPGLTMTFDRAVPFRFGNAPLPTGNGLASQRPAREKPFSGVVGLTPSHCSTYACVPAGNPETTMSKDFGCEPLSSSTSWGAVACGCSSYRTTSRPPAFILAHRG